MANWSQGNRCGFCAKNVKLSLDFIKSEFEKEGYTLLTTEYKNCSQNLEYICPFGHNRTINWSNWKGGNRCPSCSKSGEKNSNWKGGISKEPYCFEWTCDLKEYIKYRDNYKCQNPQCCGKNPNNLCVHHIDYNKKNCDLSNLITICRSCNAQANFQRDWWESFYKEVMRRNHGT